MLKSHSLQQFFLVCLQVVVILFQLFNVEQSGLHRIKKILVGTAYRINFLLHITVSWLKFSILFFKLVL